MLFRTNIGSNFGRSSSLSFIIFCKNAFLRFFISRFTTILGSTELYVPLVSITHSRCLKLFRASIIAYLSTFIISLNIASLAFPKDIRVVYIFSSNSIMGIIVQNGLYEYDGDVIRIEMSFPSDPFTLLGKSGSVWKVTLDGEFMFWENTRNDYTINWKKAL